MRTLAEYLPRTRDDFGTLAALSVIFAAAIGIMCLGVTA